MNFKTITLVIAILFFGWSTPADAQLLNGDFSSGGEHWQWYRANTQHSAAQPQNCRNALSSEGWIWGQHVNWSTNTSHPYYANGHNGNGWTAGHRRTCGLVRQNVQIPPGTRLKFDYWLGEIVADPTLLIYPVTLRAEIAQGQSTTAIRQLSGESVRPSCSNFDRCPSWRSTTADVSQFWGQNVPLQFFSESTYRTHAGNSLWYTSSPAHITNINFEPIPPNTWASPTAGNWYNPDRSGHGIDISRSPAGQIQVVWYTYLPSGTPIWYMSDLANMNQGEWSAPLNRMSRDPVSGSVTIQPVGTASLTMLANDELIYEWSLSSQSGSPSTGAEPMVHLWGGDNYSGMWFEPAYSGWGVTINTEGAGSSTSSMATSYFYTASGEPVWAQGMATGDLNNSVTFDMNTFVGIGLCPGCAGQSTSANPSPAGTLNVQQLGSSPKGYSNIQTTGGVNWIRGSADSLINYARLTNP